MNTDQHRFKRQQRNGFSSSVFICVHLWLIFFSLLLADNAFAQLNRFEETVSKEEATAKAFDQLASAGKDEDLEAQFAQLGTHSVDSELEALKKERQKPTLPRM